MPVRTARLVVDSADTTLADDLGAKRASGARDGICEDPGRFRHRATEETAGAWTAGERAFARFEDGIAALRPPLKAAPIA
jgi:hypothetical protein